MIVSAVIITLNEEKNIGRCLESLKFCDEIIVVDSGSVDNTLDIARSYNAKVFFNKWEGYAAQKNIAVALSKNKWVLSLDADEELSKSLKEEIEALSVEPFIAYQMPRKTVYLNKWIRYGGWYPNYIVRLFDKTKGKWVGEELHEKWIANGAIGKLNSPIIHYSFCDISDHVNRNNLYSTLGAKKLKAQRKHFSIFKLLVKPCWKFFETYVLKKGFLDGLPGLIISVSAAYSEFLKWVKLWEKENVKK